MDGKGRSRLLAVQSPDPVLSVAAALGLAASVKTCLIVDLVSDLRLPRARSLRHILKEGPRLDELSPGRTGVAIISGGGLDPDDAAVAIDSLGQRWPALVLRVGPARWHGPTVPVVPLYPGLLARIESDVAVWQPVGDSYLPPGPGPVLPRLRPGLARLLLAGRLPNRSRWVSAFRTVWDLPWA